MYTSMLDEEVVITPLLEPGVVALVVFVTGNLQRLVEMLHVLK